MLLYLITTVESIGVLTATSMVSGEPIEGELYLKRIYGGFLFNLIFSILFDVETKLSYDFNIRKIQRTRRIISWRFP